MDGLAERKKKEVREKIIAVAGDLFQLQGFENTTMDQIAAEAVVARKTLYNYFPVKEAIADEYVRSISKDKAGQMSRILAKLPDTRSRLIAAICNPYDWVEMNPELCRIVIMYRMKRLLQKTDQELEATGTQNLINDVLRMGRETGELGPDMPIKLVFNYIDILRSAAVLDWLNGNTQLELRKQIIRLVDLVLYGVCGKQGNNQSNDYLKKE